MEKLFVLYIKIFFQRNLDGIYHQKKLKQMQVKMVVLDQNNRIQKGHENYSH